MHDFFLRPDETQTYHLDIRIATAELLPPGNLSGWLRLAYATRRAAGGDEQEGYPELQEHQSKVIDSETRKKLTASEMSKAIQSFRKMETEVGEFQG